MGLFSLFKQKAKEKNKFTLDKAEWNFDTCLSEYCKVNNKTKDELTEDDISYIWESSSLEIAYLLTWLVDHDYINTEELDISEESIEEVKNRKVKTSEFFEREFDYTLTRDDISEYIIDFIDEYDSGDYINEFCNYMEKNNINVFCSEFSFETYKGIEKIIDAAYSKYLNK